MLKLKEEHQKIIKTSSEFDELFKEFKNSAKSETDLTDAIRRLKKMAKEFAKMSDKLIKQVDKDKMAQEAELLSQKFDAILATKQHLVSAAQHISPPTPHSLGGKIKEFFTGKKRSGSSASDGLLSPPYQDPNLSLIPNNNNVYLSPPQNSSSSQTISPEYQSSPSPQIPLSPPISREQKTDREWES
jgi:hypothetical protein